MSKCTFLMHNLLLGEVSGMNDTVVSTSIGAYGSSSIVHS